jgi:hypothetical protein
MYGIPIAVRKVDTIPINCPYCLQTHDCEPGSGHHNALCEYGGTEVSIGARSFILAYGLSVFEYIEDKGVNKLMIPDNLIFRDGV